MSRLLAAAALVLTLSASHAAAAQETVTTAGAAEAPKAQASDTAAQIEDFIRRAPPPNGRYSKGDQVFPRNRSGRNRFGSGNTSSR